MNFIMQNIAFGVSFVSFLFACHLSVARSSAHATSALLAAFFFILAAQMGLLTLTLEVGRDHWWVFLRPTLAMTVGPIAWLYFSSAANREFEIRFQHGLHFLPAIAICIELIFNKILVDIDYAIIASYAAYSLALFWQSRPGSKQFGHLRDGARLVQRWLVVGASLLALSAVSELAIVVDIYRGRDIGQSPALLAILLIDFVLVAYVLLAALRQPAAFEWMYELREKTFARRPGTYPEAEYLQCIKRLDKLIEEEQIHTQDGITVRVVAKKIGVPARLLSEAINREYGEGYSRFMNRRRVEVAQDLLRNHANLPMADVMFDAGFRTKSSFNKEFRAVTGETPSGFRQRMQARAPQREKDRS